MALGLRVPATILVALCLTVGAVGTAAPPQVNAAPPLIGDHSPDGVELWDLRDTSDVWSRAYTLNFPEGVTRESAKQECATEGPHAITVLECFEPYIDQLFWSDRSGNPMKAKDGAKPIPDLDPL